MHLLEGWLGAIPPLAVYALVCLVIGIESMGVPLPGEVVLLAAALLSVGGHISPAGVAIGASAGAIIGDSIGYLIGRHGGNRLLERLGRRFPKHAGPKQRAHAERIFHRWGVWAVFFGRFIALLRMFAGPIAGSLKMPYYKFLPANAGGGILWATGTTLAIYYIGQVAEKWLSRFSWVALAVAIAGGIVIALYLRRRASRLNDEDDAPARDHTDTTV